MLDLSHLLEDPTSGLPKVWSAGRQTHDAGEPVLSAPTSFLGRQIAVASEKHIRGLERETGEFSFEPIPPDSGGAQPLLAL